MGENLFTQKVIVIENPAPKLLEFIEKMRTEKTKRLKDSKREYIRSKFINSDKLQETFYRYKKSIDDKVPLNDKYNLYLLTENYPDDEIIEKLDNVLSILGDFLDVIILENELGEYQAFTVLNNGTNGKDSCITNSMREIVQLLDKLHLNENVRWHTILDTHIDTIDDVYAWYLTFVLT